VAQKKGYTCVFVCPDKVARDKIDVLRAYGARVEVCPTAVDPEDPRSYYSVSDRLAKEIPGAWKPDQYSNPANPRSHYEGPGRSCGSRPTAGSPTSSPAPAPAGRSAASAATSRRSPTAGSRSTVPTPSGSVYSGGDGRPYLVEGVGEDFWPSTYDASIPDGILAVSDRDSFAMTRRLAREEGLLVGGSCGMAVVAALRVAAEAGPDDVVVVLLPDSGRGYLSKIFNDDWMADYGFLQADKGTTTVGDVLARKGQDGPLPSFVHTHPSETVARRSTSCGSTASRRCRSCGPSRR
jgi:cystathionine beta-synthase